MKKTFLISTIVTTLLISACGSDRTNNNDSDSVMNDNSTIDTMSTDSGSMSTDTASMGTGQTNPDSTAFNP